MNEIFTIMILLSAEESLKNEDFDNSYEQFIKYLNICKSSDTKMHIIEYMTLLIAKGQLYQAKKFLEMPEFELKERFKPLWYALMTLMQKEFPEEIKKMGSELRESVDEILKQIETLKQNMQEEPSKVKAE